MKSNVIDMKTREKIAIDKPRNTDPGGIFMPTIDMIASIAAYGPRCFLVGALQEYANSLNIPPEDLRTLVFIFDCKNSKSFLVNNLKDKADAIFSGQVMYE